MDDLLGPKDKTVAKPFDVDSVMKVTKRKAKLHPRDAFKNLSLMEPTPETRKMERLMVETGIHTYEDLCARLSSKRVAYAYSETRIKRSREWLRSAVTGEKNIVGNVIVYDV